MESPSLTSPISQRLVADVQGGQSLRPFLESIIDKKVNQVALNLFERFIDVVCLYCYSSYKQRFDFRLKELKVDLNQDSDLEEDFDVDNEDSPAQTVAEKVHYFTDGAPLYDRTTNQRITVERVEYYDPINKNSFFGEDQIKVDGKPVYFFPKTTHKMLFGKAFNTKEVVVADVKEFPELVMIFEREISNQFKAWVIDTSQPAQKVKMGGMLIIGKPEDVFYAEPFAPLNPPPQIIDDMIP